MMHECMTAEALGDEIILQDPIERVAWERRCGPPHREKFELWRVVNDGDGAIKKWSRKSNRDNFKTSSTADGTTFFPTYTVQFKFESP